MKSANFSRLYTPSPPYNHAIYRYYHPPLGSTPPSVRTSYVNVPQGAASAGGEAEDPCGGATGGAAAEEEAEDERDVQATATAADARKVTNMHCLKVA